MTSEQQRDLRWRHCVNARDLGGLRTRNGGRTLSGRVVRSDNPGLLTADGRTALERYGIKTIMWLTTTGAPTDEEEPPSVEGTEVRTVMVEDLSDPQFVSSCVETGLWCTPLYFPLMLRHWPSVCVEIVAAVASAGPGGVVVSCLRGRDRTGLAAFLLLSLAGVEPEEIAVDWELSVARLRAKIPSYESLLADLLVQNDTTVVGSIRATCERFQVAEHLVRHGLSQHDLQRVRQRLLGHEDEARLRRGTAGSRPSRRSDRSAGEVATGDQMLDAQTAEVSPWP